MTGFGHGDPGDEHQPPRVVTSWLCWNCAIPRRLEEFPTPCACGSHVLVFVPDKPGQSGGLLTPLADETGWEPPEGWERTADVCLECGAAIYRREMAGPNVTLLCVTDLKERYA